MIPRFYQTEIPFAQQAVARWEYQRQANPHIARFCDLLDDTKQTIVPIVGFKEFEMKDGDWQAEAVFESSGTTGQKPSRHFVKDLTIYKEAALAGFFHFFPRKEYRILALLPNYLERGNSSLVQMVKLWMDEFGLPNSGFYLYNFEALSESISEAAGAREPILLIGVAYALLDFAAQHPQALPPDALVLETGGMKGRKKEITRDELHQHLRKGLGIDQIYSEYGMTELLSQCYTGSHGRFMTPPWMKVVLSDLHLPDLPVAQGSSGRINIIDLANVHSCSFIATDDLGRMHPDGSFEVLGRIDNSELRGCSLMY
jgi:phenylacetate-coenzyme A ligase PaaK-like adenylate-forming protein